MECPKCGFADAHDFAECPHCGIVVAKFLRAHELEPEFAGVPAAALAAADTPTETSDAATRRELIARAVALPAALAAARIAVNAAPGPVRLITMWVHESGHAVTAWLCGFSALPSAWITPVAPQRSPLFSLALAGALLLGAYAARQRQRWFWVGVSVTILPLMFFLTVMIPSLKAHQLITFGGDGGCFVLGTMLMLTVYAREGHPLRENEIRWGLLIIGALAFVDAYTVWSGPIDRLPFGENENGISDPSVLTEIYGWNVLMLIRRYIDLARVCFAVLVTVYAGQLYRGVRSFLGNRKS